MRLAVLVNTDFILVLVRESVGEMSGESETNPPNDKTQCDC